MENGSMITVAKQYGNGFTTLVASEGWKVAFITYSEQYDVLREMKRHLKTDEVFILLQGSAVLYIKEDKLEQYEMQKNTVYNVKKNTWHHVKVSFDAVVAVVENSNTTKENTERKAELC